VRGARAPTEVRRFDRYASGHPAIGQVRLCWGTCRRIPNRSFLATVSVGGRNREISDRTLTAIFSDRPLRWTRERVKNVISGYR
jgi:hypothetical protein